jgi:hypothetical protein
MEINVEGDAVVSTSTCSPDRACVPNGFIVESKFRCFKSIAVLEAGLVVTQWNVLDRHDVTLHTRVLLLQAAQRLVFSFIFSFFFFFFFFFVVSRAAGCVVS